MALLAKLLGLLFPPQPEPLAEVRAGSRVLVRGQVLPRDLLDSPLSRRRCVYYQYTVEEWRQSRALLDGDGFWQLREQDEAIVEFYLKDGDTRAVVAPHRAVIEPARGIEPEQLDLGGSHRRARELCICPGDLIEVEAVVDEVDDLFDEARTYRDRPTRLLLRAPPGELLVIRLLWSGGLSGLSAKVP
jgi:hypothetical protein